jgi:hypothetical protein
VTNQLTKDIPAGLGFRVKSGWAVAALVAGTAESPHLVQCQAALLSDPRVPESKQPYHVTLKLPQQQEAHVVQKLRQVVSSAAKSSIADLLKQAKAAGCAVRGAALVVGSVVDPATLHNEHIRAHALEGQLFRTVLEEAFHAHGLPCQIMLERSAYATAANALGKTPARMKRMATSLGDSHNGPWRAEEKLAAIAAWLALSAQS